MGKRDPQGEHRGALVTAKRPIPEGVRGAIASARIALDRARENAPEPAKDQAEKVAEAEEWRERTYTDEEATP